MKRFLDIIGSGVGLILLSPVLVLLWVKIGRDMGSPVIFSQVRPGLNAKPFKMIKFRSMKDANGLDGTPLPDSERITRRMDVRPGVTGWAQINGRNALSWDEKFVLDLWYVDNRSIWLDFKILWLTARKVIKRDGISAAGEATMPKFTGNS